MGLTASVIVPLTLGRVAPEIVSLTTTIGCTYNHLHSNRFQYVNLFIIQLLRQFGVLRNYMTFIKSCVLHQCHAINPFSKINTKHF